MLRTQNVKCRKQTGSKGHVSGWISATNRVQGKRALRNGKCVRVSFIWSIMRCYGILSGCRLFWNCFAISFLSTRRFLFDNFFNQVYRFIYFFFLNSFSTLWEKNVLSWKISEGTILRYIIQVARFGEEEKYNGYLIREMKLILCSRDGICEKLYSLPTSGHDDIGRVGKWWARDWYDIKGYWSFSEYCRSNVLESCNDSMNSLHYDIPSSMLPRIIERWVNVVIYIYTYN